jgi:hypothetical protein
MDANGTGMTISDVLALRHDNPYGYVGYPMGGYGAYPYYHKRNGAATTAIGLSAGLGGAALSDKSINKSVTKWDKFVAANAFWHDLSNDFTDEQIICATYKFWFADEDWHSDGKIWDYMKII